jgi:hypothetical protein
MVSGLEAGFWRQSKKMNKSGQIGPIKRSKSWQQIM